MKLNKLSKYADTGLLLLRVAFGFRLIYGTIDNILSWERMLEFAQFLEKFQFPVPIVSAVLSVALQFLAGLSWIIGYQVRLAALVMVLNFGVALFMVHLTDTYLGSAPAIHMLVVSLFLLVNGPGKYALDKSV